MKVWIAWAFLILVSCSHAPLIDSKPQILSSVPEHAFQSSDPHHVTIAVVGINDFHGNLLPRERKLADGSTLRSGGAPALASMIQILKNEMNGQVLIVDAGDEFQGTPESNEVKGESVVHFFNLLGVHAASIGNHEFDFSLDNLKARARQAHYPYLASNIYELKSHLRPRWKNVFPSKRIRVGEIEVGIVGVSTQGTRSAARYEFVKDLQFTEASEDVKTEASQLRKEGASAVLVTAHAGTRCKDSTSDLQRWLLRQSEDRQGVCEEGEIALLAKKVGSNVLDGIISGHTHQVIHHWIAGVPVVQGESFNQFFNIIYLTFDRTSHALIPSLTRIEGLIPICEKFFEGTQHCDARRLSAKDSLKQVNSTFHGQALSPVKKVESWLAPIRARSEKNRNEVLGYAARPVMHAKDRESEFGNWMADVLREKAKSDFSIVNSGSIRASLDAGPLTYDTLFKAIPFDNLLTVVSLTGKQVRLLFEIATAGNHGLVGLSGLNIKVRPLSSPAESRDLSGDGKREPWEMNRLLEIKLPQGKELQDSKLYTVAMYDFLANGGDDFYWLMNQIPENQIHRLPESSLFLAREYLLKHKTINPPSKPLIDPKYPRIQVSDYLIIE